MKTFSFLQALLLSAACFCLSSAIAEDPKFAPATIEMYRCQDVLQMTMDLLPLCADAGWDVGSITKAAQAEAECEYPIRKAYNERDRKDPNDKRVEEAEERRESLLKAALSSKQIQQLQELKRITDLIDDEDDAASEAYAQAYAKKLPAIVFKSPVLTPKEVSGWKVSLEDVREVLEKMQKDPRLASPKIQAAIGLAQEALKKAPEKAEALLRQLTETLQKAEVVM
ncbi:hypothetical protein [Prosthecobacter sp.]|uniref:hypothetical protein n=1 Tax=Prosthecobacter sp. TaxID=1965333 RepID=UPI003784D030